MPSTEEIEKDEPTEEDEALESEIMARIAKEASLNAIEETFRLGLSIMTVQGDSIVRMYPDGSTEFVRKRDKLPVVPEKRDYHL